MRCPKCNKIVYSHHQKTYKSGTGIMRYYACRYCKHKFETFEYILENDEACTVFNKDESPSIFMEKKINMGNSSDDSNNENKDTMTNLEVYYKWG